MKNPPRRAAPAGFLLPGDKCRAQKSRSGKPDRLDNNPEGLLLAASFFQHAQSTLVSFVSSLLCFLSSSQSFISFTVRRASVSFDALLQPVARTAARARAENFRTLFIVFPFKDFQIKWLSPHD
jgi:hypothetical protein